MITSWINGVFDTVHRGHIEMFKYANSISPVVVVGIEGDEMHHKRTGFYPTNTEIDRKFVLESVKHIDSVVIYNTEEELKHYILAFRAYYMILSSEYRNQENVGSDLVEVLYYFDKIQGYPNPSFIKKKK